MKNLEPIRVSTDDLFESEDYTRHIQRDISTNSVKSTHIQVHAHIVLGWEDYFEIAKRTAVKVLSSPVLVAVFVAIL